MGPWISQRRVYSWDSDNIKNGISTQSHKKLIRSKCSLMELFYRLTEFSHGKNSEQEVEKKPNNEVTQIRSKDYLLIQLKNQCTDFIYQKC